MRGAGNSKGINGACLDIVEREEVNLYISSEMKTEVHNALDREVLIKRIPNLTEERVEYMKNWIEKHAIEINPTPLFQHFTLSSDMEVAHKDDKVLNAAYAAKVDFVVTGDKQHLLPLNVVEAFQRDFPTTLIVDPVDFVRERCYERQHGELKHEQILEHDWSIEL